jgi:hypothetical protein
MSFIEIRTVGRKEARGSIGVVAFVVFAAAGLALLGLAGCSSNAPGSARTTEELLGQLHDDREAIDHASDQMMQRIEIFNSTRKPGEATLQFAELFSQDLNPEQKDILNQMVEQEKDVSYKSLLTKIIADRNTIKDLQDKMAHLEQSLPDQFVIAKRGDKHRTLALNYLTRDAHLDEAKAREVMRQSDQTDELVPGNKVWFFYNPKDDTFRTYVTRGEALQTPVMVRRAQKKELVRERDGALAQRDTAQQEAAAKEEQRAALETEMATRENSVYYHAASNTSLKESGILSPVLSKVQEVKGIGYNESLDLRTKTTIDLVPERYGLQQIRSVRVLPDIYREGRDYNVETTSDYSSARVVLLDPEVFKGKELLLALSR